jgi:serine/threonine protein kinase
VSAKPGRIRCPHCSHVFQLPEGDESHVNCPSCSARLRIRVRPNAAADTGSASASTSSRDLPKASEGADSGAPAVRRDNVEMLPPGTILGGYQIKSLLGKGGMAIVYLGVQRSLNRQVAIKVLNSNYASNRAFVQRFDQEAGALASLNHPNIVNIIDKGHEGRHYYFVMEHVEGRTLEQLIGSTELSYRHYAHIVGEISRALTYVHSRKVIHRDIKPSNIMVTPEWQVKVGDFGIAHIVEDEAEGSQTPKKRATIGTAFYMAPEQATHANQVDRRADVYSLGVTFYKMFTRTLPQKPVSQWPPVTEINSLLPMALDSVLQRAMDSYPDQRYPTVEEFCNDVLRVFRDHMDGRAASTSALLESSSRLFEQAYKKEQSRAASSPLPLKGPLSDSTSHGILAGLDAAVVQNLPGLGISGISAPESKPAPVAVTPRGLGEGSAPISTFATLDQILNPGSASRDSAPAKMDLGAAKTEPAPLPPGEGPPPPKMTVSIVVWVILVVILLGSGYLLYLAFNQGN